MKYLMSLLLASFLWLPVMAETGEHVLDNSEVLETSSFRGDSGHATSGTARLIRHGRNYYVHLENNFKFDGAPDPQLGFSKNGSLVKSSLFSKLTSNDGTQLYRLRSDFRPADFDELTLYCKKFNVPLGHAKW